MSCWLCISVNTYYIRTYAGFVGTYVLRGKWHVTSPAGVQCYVSFSCCLVALPHLIWALGQRAWIVVVAWGPSLVAAFVQCSEQHPS